MKILDLNVNAPSIPESHRLASQLHGSTGATSQGYWNKMFRGSLCSSIEMLKGSCSFSLLKRVKEFMGFVAGEGKKIENTNVALLH